VKPGITGWSQVMGFRGETRELKEMEDRIRGDIYYIEHWTLELDLFIMYKTVANVFKGEDNAY
jgi:putative colanic acid biosynthesis UDP-glucose lipid carrier transferase